MMVSVIKLIIAALVPVFVSCVFYMLEKREKFMKIPYAARQSIYGVVFGLVAVMGTEWGISMNGFMVNCRDAAPLAAGLLFGAPAGIIAGLIGGIERYVAVCWGVGSFTRVACSVSTIICGFIGAIIRKFLLENKKASWELGLGVGIVMEIFHLNMVFITNIKDATKAIRVVDACFVPMVTSVGLSVMLSIIAVSFLSGEIKKKEKKQATPIFQTIQRWLMLVLSLVFVAAMIFNYIIQSNLSTKEANGLINSALEEISQDVTDASDRYMMQTTRTIAREVNSGYYSMDKLIDRYEFTELSIVDENGIIIDSNVPEYIGFDMASGEQSAEFLCLLGDTEEFVQPYGPIAIDNTVYRKYAGVKISKGFVQMGYDAKCFKKEVDNQIRYMADNTHVGETGGVIILDDNNRLVSFSKKLVRKTFDKTAINTIRDRNENEITEIVLGDTNYYMSSRNIEGYLVAAFYSVDAANADKAVSIYVSLFTMLLIFGIMFVLIYLLIKKIVVNQIMQMAESLSIITAGNLDEVVNVRSNKEFASLSDDINSTVDTLKHYIDEAAARIDKELEFAKNIQESALPHVFPDYEKYKLFASMHTAKEVGGDFYDFYQTQGDIVNFLIADVSRKGIPAAMFIMRAKAVLKSFTKRGLEVNEVFMEGNDNLCSGNDAGMFVTAWQGALDLGTGKVKFANAGHNLPAVKHKDGKFDFVKQKVNLVLAGMEGLPYALNELTLEHGDIIYLYTDGVTEATNAQNELFGDDRLLMALNSGDYSDPKEICEVVKQHVDDFVMEADQFDDITMVCMLYK